MLFRSIIRSDGGTAFYKQKRLTMNGKVFEVLKFRSMKMDAEKDGVARLSTGENDPRVTKVGRFIRSCRLEARAIIRLTAGNLNSKGFCEYSPFQIFPKFSPPRGSILALAL